MSLKKLNRKKRLVLAISTISAVIAGSMGSISQAQEVEEITITGSRLVKRDLGAATPIVTVGSEAFENSANVSVESTLNQLPQFVPSGTQFSSGIQSGPTASPGAATLNLRGLGDNRNLVLVNGRRAQPGNASLVVDINTIPASAISNVEVITGGASAVYGPDAMAGVVNFNLKDSFEGVEFDYQTTDTEEGGGQQNKFSVLFGANTEDGRGNVMLALDYTKRDSIDQIDRDFYVDGWNDPANVGGGFLMAPTLGGSSTNGPSQAVIDSFFPGANVSTGNDFSFNADGTPFISTSGLGYNGPLNCWEGCGAYTGVKQLPNGNLDQTFTGAYLSTPMERHNIFGRADYDISDSINAFAQASYTNSVVSTRGGIPPAITVWQAPITRGGTGVPAALDTLLDSRVTDPAADWNLYRVLDFNGPIQPENTTDVWQVLVGLKGEIGDDTTWEAYASRGETHINKVNNALPSLQRYQTLVNNGAFGVGGASAARGYNISCDSGLPIFTQFTPDAACLDGIDSKMVDTTDLTQEIFEANIQGKVMDLPAGEVRYAAGGTYRANSFDYQPGNPAGSIIDNPIGLFASNATGGKIDVTEFYAELLVPVIDGLDLELGYRISDFSTAGKHDTYKALFTWQAMDQVTFRGGYQVATRAPNIAELFQAPTQVVVGISGQEPCSSTTQNAWGNLASNPDRLQVQALCRALIGNSTSPFDTQTFSESGIAGPDGWHRPSPSYFPLAIEERSGNVNVDVETGETFTLGAVISDPFDIENLTVTLDAYKIELSDSISPISASTIYDNCFNRYGTNATYDVNNSFCQLISRNPVTGDRQQVSALFLNLGILETQGLDVQVNWSAEIGPGSFTMSSSMNYLDAFDYQTAPGQAIVDAKGTLDQGGLYDFRATTRFGYSWDNFNVGLTWRHLSSVEDVAKSTNPNTPFEGAGAYDIFALNGSYNWENYSVRVGIDNLFNADPEVIGSVDPTGDSNSNSTSPAFYDVVGRSYFLGLKATF